MSYPLEYNSSLAIEEVSQIHTIYEGFLTASYKGSKHPLAAMMES